MPKQVPFQYSVAPAANIAVNTNARLTIQTQSDSYFVVRGIIGSRDNNDVAVLFNDNGSGLNWASDAVFANSILGIGQRPYKLLSPLVINPTSTIQARVENGATGAQTPANFQLVLDGYKHYDLANAPLQEQMVGGLGRRKWFFQYVANFALAANQRLEGVITIQADSFFYCQEVFSTQTGRFRVRLADSGSGRIWSDGQIRDDNYFGVVEYPKRLYPAAVLNPSATVTVEVEDLSGAPNTIQVVLAGYKKWVR